MSEWKYGDILRRAVTMKPLVHAYVMFLGPGRARDRKPRGESFTGMRLTEVGDFEQGRAGWVGERLSRELFELAPEDEQ